MHDRERSAGIVAAGVGVVETFGNFPNDVSGYVRRESSLFSAGRVHELAKIRAVDVLHAEQLAILAIILKVINLDDVGVIEARC